MSVASRLPDRIVLGQGTVRHRIGGTILAATAAIVVAAGFAPAARADGNVDPRIVYSIDGLLPKATGVTATISPPQVAHLPPLVQIVNDSPSELVIFDPENVPMIRTGRKGTFGNVRSRYLNAALNPTTRGPASSVPSGSGPAWRVIGVRQKVRYYDPRATYEGHAPPDPSKPSVLLRFSIPATLHGATVTIAGHISWKPVLGSVEPRIALVRPSIPDVQVAVARGPIPVIEIENRSPQTIEIIGRDGRPFGRVGPRGVDINVNSAAWRDTKSLPPATSTTPKWTHAQDRPVLGWLERRAAYKGDPPADVQNSRTRRLIARWRVLGSIDGQPFTIDGASDWVPTAAIKAPDARPARASRESSSDWWWPAAIGAGLIAVALAALYVVRRWT